MGKTLIAVPSHDYVHADFTRSLMELDKPAGTGFAMITNTLIYTARNLIAQNAVKAGFDQVLWLDADMTFPSDTLIRLDEDMQGRDLVTGLYFTRKEPIVPTLHKEIHWSIREDGWVDGGATLYRDYPKDQLFEIAGCGFGCVMTSARLLQRMIEKFGSPFYPLMGMGEDSTFCFRATQDGFKLYCDSRIKCGHIGQKEYTEKDYQARGAHNDRCGSLCMLRRGYPGRSAGLRKMQSRKPARKELPDIRYPGRLRPVLDAF